MAVGNIVTRVPRKGRRIFSGEFTGANGSLSGAKFKGEVTVTYGGEGVYNFAFVEGKQGRLAGMVHTIINPANTDGGSGRVLVTADTVATNGQFTVTTFNQANAAADIIGVAKFDFIVEGEAA